MTTKTEKTETKIKLENVRLSYPNLFVAKVAKDDKGGDKAAKFDATFILDKKQHANLIKQIQVEVERVALDEFKKKVPLKHAVLRDGSEREDKEGYGDDVMFLAAKSETRPPVVDKDLTPLVKEDGKPYAGCYVNATIRLYAYNHPTGGKGVAASLRAVQFLKDGPSFGAGPVDASEEFEAVSDDVSNY